MRQLVMKHKGRVPGIIFLLFLIVFAGPVGAHPEPLHATLKNGLRVVIEQNSLAPVAAVAMNYLVGSNESPAGFSGMAHAQEHMMFRGSRGLSGDQLSTLIASMGGDFNAETQQTVTQYFFTVPAELLDVALKIEATRMRDVLDSEDQWEKERGAIEQEVAQDLSNPLYLFSSRLLEKLFAGTPYAQDALGTRPSFQRTTGAMLKKFHETWYVPNNAVLVIVGDVDPRKTLSLVRQLFEPIPSRPLPSRTKIKLAPLKAAAIALETDLPNGMAVVAYRLPGSDSPDYAAGEVLADVLDSKRAKLYGLVPEGKALQAGFDGAALPLASYGFAAVSFPQGEDGKPLIASIKEIIAGYVKEGVPADLVEAAKHNEISDAEFRRNSIAGLAAEWSQAVAVEGRASLDDDIDSVRKVTKQDVDRVARMYLKNDRAVVALLTPKRSGDPAPETAVPAKESFAPREATPVTVPSWARKATVLPTVREPRRTPSVNVLANGLTLIVYPSSFSRTVSVYGQVLNNPLLQMPEDKEGVAQLLEVLFSHGTKKMERLEFQQALDEISADETAGTSFSLRVLSDRFDRGMELLADNLLQPALPDQAFIRMRTAAASALAGELQSPSYRSSRALQSALYPEDDESLREATPGIMNSITLDDVKAYYRSVFRPDMTTIVIIGDVTPERALTTTKKYFGAWTAAGPKPQIDLPAAPPSKAAATSVPDEGRVQTEVTLAETLGITRQNADYYALELGRTVLSGAFYSTRLYRDLRGEAGLVYSVDTFLEAGRTRSLFGISCACDPPNVSRVRAIIERNLRTMQTATVPDEELVQAKTLLIRRVSLARSSLDGIAEELLHLSKEGLPLDEPTVAAKRFRDLTADEVRKAFARWIRTDDFAQVTLGPAAK
jgi:zinc protease